MDNYLSNSSIIYCPYIGMTDDNTTCLSYPSAANYCYYCAPSATPILSFQAEYCLSNKFHTCPVFLDDPKKDFPSRYKLSQRRRNTPRTLLWVGGVLILIGLMLFISTWFIHGNTLADFLPNRITPTDFMPGASSSSGLVTTPLSIFALVNTSTSTQTKASTNTATQTSTPANTATSTATQTPTPSETPTITPTNTSTLPYWYWWTSTPTHTRTPTRTKTTPPPTIPPLDTPVPTEITPDTETPVTPTDVVP